MKKTALACVFLLLSVSLLIGCGSRSVVTSTQAPMSPTPAAPTPQPVSPTPTPVHSVSSVLTGLQQLSVGSAHDCAVTTSGGVKCWGRNDHGQLGDGTTTDRYLPVDVVGLNSGVSAVSVGQSHSCALTTEGGVKCWGLNTSGILGDGTSNDSSTPVDVVGLSSGVTAISAGSYHTCAITAGGGVKCWGHNSLGELGNGVTDQETTIPVDARGLGSGIKALAAGSDHTCSLSTKGGIRCWGNIGIDQLGNGSPTRPHTPIDVFGLTSGVAAITSGDQFTCILTTEGGIKCWGSNTNGQLGDGTTEDRYTLTDVSGLTANVSAITSGHSHVCALTTQGEVQCWGQNQQGQLNDGTTTDRSTPGKVTGLTAKATALFGGAAGNQTCALTIDGNTSCWGSNVYGQLGDGTTWQ